MHSETYKVLGGLHRQEQASKQVQDGRRESNIVQADPDLFAMLNQMADQNSEVSQQQNSLMRKRQSKGGVAV